MPSKVQLDASLRRALSNSWHAAKCLVDDDNSDRVALRLAEENALTDEQWETIAKKYGGPSEWHKGENGENPSP